MKPIMRDGVRSDQQLESKHTTRKIAHRERRHARARFGIGLRSYPLRNTQQERASSRRGIEDRDARIAQPLSPEVFVQSAIKRTYHVAHYLNRRVIHAVALTRVV